MYIYQRKEWPNFSWNEAKLTDLLAEVHYLQGLLLGRMQSLGFSYQNEASLAILTQDVIKTSEIEGEKLDYEQVRSSLAKRLGINIGALAKADRNVEGIVEMILDATKRYAEPLTAQRLFDWHSSLFQHERNMVQPIRLGKWRDKSSGPMQVISGAFGHEKIHFEAPEYEQLKKEMKRFLDWFNRQSDLNLVIKSGIAHLWFVTIHPFEDGNGRIARAIADMLLARAENSAQRFYSMSAQIRLEHNDYYYVLEQSQKGSLDITLWLDWYLNCLKHAIHASEKILDAVLIKARFWQTYKNEVFNERQKNIINRLLDEFEGKLTTSKWAKLGKCSQDTALRDIQDLLDRKILTKESAGGRSTSYWLVEMPHSKKNV